MVRLLFVSSTTMGGSGRSQRELAERLVRNGHEVRFLVDDGSKARLRRWTYEQLSDFAARVRQRGLFHTVDRLERWPGRRTHVRMLDGLVHITTPVPENAIVDVIDRFEPDVVIGNSLVRLSWRRVLAACRAQGIRSVLYIRETDSLGHLDGTDLPDVIVANARSLAQAVTDRGLPCAFIPSVVAVDATRTTSTRRTALVINPIASRGVDLIAEIARGVPDIPFVLQESWTLCGENLRKVERIAESAGNIEFRRAAPPGPELYGDARVVVVPYVVNNRPRVIAEAQANGIPVIAADRAALREATGPGGILVDPYDADPWCAALRSLWADDGRYHSLSDAALLHSGRAEVDPAGVTRMFESVLADLVRGPGDTGT